MLKEIMEIKSNDGERKTGKGEEDGKGGGGRERGRRTGKGEGVLGSDKRKIKRLRKKNRNEEKIAFEFDSKNISIIIVSKYFIKKCLQKGVLRKKEKMSSHKKAILKHFINWLENY